MTLWDITNLMGFGVHLLLQNVIQSRHEVQSVDSGPVHVLHQYEQGRHSEFVEYVPFPQVVKESSEFKGS